MSCATNVVRTSLWIQTLSLGRCIAAKRAAWLVLIGGLSCGSALAQPTQPDGRADEPQAASGTAESIVEEFRVAIEGVTRVCPAQHAAYADATGTLAVLDRSLITSAEASPKGVPLKFAAANDGSGSNTISIPIEAGTSLYGLGPAPGSILRNGQRHECWSGDPARTAWPWVLAVRADGSAFGVLADTMRACRVDLSATADHKAGEVVFGFPGEPGGGEGSGGLPAVIVIEGRDATQVLERLAQVIGAPALAPSWAFGFLQHAGSSQADALARAESLRRDKLPASGLFITPALSERFLSFDSSLFPDPRAMTQRLTQQGFAAAWTTSVWVPDVPGNVVRDQLVNSRFALRDAAEGPSQARPLSGNAAKRDATFAQISPDFARAEVRQWWGKMHADLFAPRNGGGLAGLFLEPQADRLQHTARSLGGTWLENQPIASVELGDAPGAWGLLTSGAAHAAIESQRKGLRVASFTNEPTVGSARYAAALLAPRQSESAAQFNDRLLSAALSGQPVLGANLPAASATSAMAKSEGSGGGRGGEAGGSDANLQSWAAAALLPIALADAVAESSSDAASVRQTLERRARLMPYIYSCAARADASGTPMLSPVFMAAPSAMELRAESGAFLLGPDILISDSASHSRVLEALNVASNGAAWERFHLVAEGENSSLPQLHIRPGAIVPIGPVIQHTQERHEGPLVLLVNLDAGGQASGELYEDFGDSTEYRGGKFLRTTYAATLTGSKCQVQIANKEGTHPRGRRDLLVVLLRPDGWFMTAKGTDGMSLTFDLSRIQPVAMNGQDAATSVPGRDAVPPRSQSSPGR